MRSLSRLLVVVCITLLGATVSVAANPESGKLSAASPEVKWSGEAGPYPGGILYGDDGAGPDCEAPNCDVFTLEVADGPADITFELTTTNYSNVEFDVTKPDGQTVYETTDENVETRKLTIKDAPNGTYKVNTWPYSLSIEPMQYTAKVKRAGAGAPGPGSTATPGPGSTATPTPGPAAKPTITIRAGRLSARKIKRSLGVSLTASSRVDNVVATFKKGSKALGTAKLASLEGTKKLKIKLKKKLKAGKYSLSVVADDGRGGKVTASVMLTVRK